MSSVATGRAVKVASIIGKVAVGLILAWACLALFFGVVVPWMIRAHEAEKAKTYVYRVAAINSWGCKDDGDLKHIGRNPTFDSERFRYAMKHCKIFQPGEEVVFKKSKPLSGFYFAIPHSSQDSDGYWFYRESLEEKGAPRYAYSIEKSGTFGCRDQSDMDRIVELSVVQKDDAASGRHLNALVQLARCRYFPAGAQLVIEDRSGWKSMYRARVAGDPTSYWIPMEFVAKREVKTTAVSSRP